MIRLGFQFALTSFLILNGCGAADSSKDANSDKLFTDATEHMGLNFTHDPGVDGGGRLRPPPFARMLQAVGLAD